MKGIKFGNYHSYDDLHLILTSKEIGSPEPKRSSIDIEGSDGVLDLTEVFGYVSYSNRTLKFDFATIENQYAAQYSEILDALNGQEMQIIFDDNPLYYYFGRLTVSAYTNDKTIGKISIECDCEPYQMKVTETVVTQAVSGTKTITLSNSRKRVVPTITTTASMTFAWGGNSIAKGAGTFVIPELELAEGSNTLTVTGTGNVTFRYREGRL